MDWIQVIARCLNKDENPIQLYEIWVEEYQYFMICDDGFTIANIEQSGVDFETLKPKIERILRRFDIQIKEGNELYLLANKEEINEKKQILTKAIMAMNNLL